MSLNLTNKNYVVTGGSRGLGRPIVEALAAAGATVFSGQRTAADGVEHANVHNVSVDLTNRVSIAAFCQQMPTRIDGFIGNAGLLGDICKIDDGAADIWLDTQFVNVAANYLLLRQLRQAMLAAPHCRGVFMTSRSAYKGKPEWSAYSASKAGLDALVMAFAAETAETGIKVNLFSPGPMRTDMRASAVPGEDPMTLPTPDVLVPAVLDLLVEDLQHSGKIFDYSSGEFCMVRLPEPL
ncbi:SDR family oxidoreductase [bacterium]|jgi:NAD(P)-dependent dehydrogenase (short-subunit alcohol dehydrogenase family)|nr:SDR family oxidoreductase [bacterium]